MVTESDIKRIEEKLDLLIEFFGIGARPRKSIAQIDDFARAAVLEFQKKKDKNGRPATRRKLAN